MFRGHLNHIQRAYFTNNLNVFRGNTRLQRSVITDQVAQASLTSCTERGVRLNSPVWVLSADDLMADQRMDISSTMTDFMSPGSTDIISSSISTPGMDYTRKRKGSTTDYQ